MTDDIHDIYNEYKNEFENSVLLFRVRSGGCVVLQDDTTVVSRFYNGRIHKRHGIRYMKLSRNEMREAIMRINTRFCVIMTVIDELCLL